MLATNQSEGVAMNQTQTNQTSVERVSDREIVIRRMFNAPSRIVFDAWTKPELVKRWWAPKSHGVAIAVCEADVRVGGRYRYVLRSDGAGEFAFSGEYTEVTPHSRLAYTQSFEPMPGAAVVTVTFEDRAGKTQLVARETYPSKEALDAALGSGMEHGLRETLDQLDELAASLGGAQ